jgi:hypothetical protein
MKVNSQVSCVKAGRRMVLTLSAALVLLLSASSTRANPGGQPNAFCGFTGVQKLVLRQGEVFPLPRHYENLTLDTWKFYVIRLSGGDKFGLPTELMSASFGKPLELKPYKSVTFRSGSGYTLPLSTPTGTAERVIVMVQANFLGTSISKILHLATCEYELEVTPLIPELQEPGKDGE